MSFSIKEIRQVFILDDLGRVVLLEGFPNKFKKASNFSEFIDIENVENAGERFFNILSQNNFIQYPISS